MKRIVAIVVVALVLAAIVWWRSSSGGGADEAATAAAGEPPRGRVAPRLGEAPVLPAAGAPVALGRRNLPPPPPNFDPGSESRALTPAERKLAEGVFPLRPPYFDDPDKRAEFRDWWERELKRRYQAYKSEREGNFPPDEVADEMFDRLYELGEAPRSGETPAEFDQRVHQWTELLSEFDDTFGTRPIGIISFGADPQYGEPEEPPFVPEGADEPVTEHPDKFEPVGGEADDAPPLVPARPR